MIRVFHLRDPHFAAGVRGEVFPLNEYVPVADVATDEAGEAYMLTNHVEQDWTTGSRVTLLDPIYAEPVCGPRVHRSTSVGDLMCLPDGSYVVVAGVGFKPYPYPMCLPDGSYVFVVAGGGFNR
jgi:hypothetical protein